MEADKITCYSCKKSIPKNTKYCKYCGSVQVIDDELIHKVRDGDQKAFDCLYWKSYQTVIWTIRSSAKLDDDTVMDILQNTYIKAYSSIHTLKSHGAFNGWIKTIARNETIDYLRKQKHKEIFFSDMASDDTEVEEIEFEDERMEANPEAQIEYDERKAILSSILDELPEEQRIVISMQYYQDMNVKEIAKELGVSENTVKSRANYGRKKIESKVRDLQKKGINLLGLSGMGFFLWLLSGISTQAAELPSAATLSAVKTSAGLGVASAGVKTEVAKKGLKATLTKFFAGVTTVAVVGTGVAIYNKPVEPHYVKDYKELKSKDIEVITDFAYDYIEQFFEEEDWLTVVNENGESFDLHDEDMEEAEKSVKLEDWCYFAVDQEEQAIYGYGFAPNMIYIPCTINVDGNEYVNFITILGVYMNEDKSITVSQDFNLDLVVFGYFYESMDLLVQKQIEGSGHLQSSYKVSKENLK